MEFANQTAVSEFLLLGLSEDPDLQPLIFGLFLSMYLVTILGNLLIVLAVGSDPRLHTPMYFFLSNLSFNDICLSSTTVPKMLANIRAQDQSITYPGCLSQVGLVLGFSSLEDFLLAVMAYDRYVAICHPLQYTVIMSPRLCGLLALSSLLLSITNALLHSLTLLQASFCTDVRIPHFFCELTQMIQIACSDTLVHKVLMFVVTCVIGGIPLSGIIISYVHIASSVLRMPSSEGKYKAFSTCGSHLFVISLFYGPGVGVYLGSTTSDFLGKTAVASMMYSVVPPMLNPFIYSLRNRDVKEALRKLTGRTAALS